MKATIDFTYSSLSTLSDLFCISLDRAGRAYVGTTNCDMDKLNHRLVEIYKELLDGKPNSSK